LVVGAHRAHIALSELNIPFEEEIIDLTVPRTAEYLKVNPRGLVPSLAVDGEIITESAVVSAFLADAFPSHLAPASNDPNGALTRARIAFFADAFMSKVNSSVYPLIMSKSDEERSTLAQKIVDAVVKEVEPLLTNAGPFFNGSDKPTLAEVQRTPLFPVHYADRQALRANNERPSIGSDRFLRDTLGHLAQVRAPPREPAQGHSGQGTQLYPLG
jgi:glutathione S-transferase